MLESRADEHALGAQAGDEVALVAGGCGAGANDSLELPPAGVLDGNPRDRVAVAGAPADSDFGGLEAALAGAAAAALDLTGPELLLERPTCLLSAGAVHVHAGGLAVLPHEG